MKFILEHDEMLSLEDSVFYTPLIFKENYGQTVEEDFCKI